MQTVERSRTERHVITHGEYEVLVVLQYQNSTLTTWSVTPPSTKCFVFTESQDPGLLHGISRLLDAAASLIATRRAE